MDDGLKLVDARMAEQTFNDALGINSVTHPHRNSEITGPWVWRIDFWMTG